MKVLNSLHLTFSGTSSESRERHMFIFCVSLFLWCATDVVADISCSFQLNFCSWNPYVKGGTWAIANNSVSVDLTNGIRPPRENASMAYVISSEESWAELLSEEVTLDRSSKLTFEVLQTRFPFSTHIAQAQLLLSSANGTTNVLIWSIQASVHWSKAQVVLPAVHQHRLLFRFRVGFNRQIAALANITLITDPASLGIDLMHAEALTEEQPQKVNIPLADGAADGQITCSFAKSKCGWQDEQSMWNRTTAAGIKPFFVLRAAANTSDDKFLEFRGVSANSPTEGQLRSLTFENTGPRNLTFLYTKRGESQKDVCLTLHMLGLRLRSKLNETNASSKDQNATDITMDTEKYSEDQNDIMTQIWQGVVTDGHKKWTKATVALNETGNITLVFVCKANVYTLCALDNIVLDEEEAITSTDSGPKRLALSTLLFYVLSIMFNFVV